MSRESDDNLSSINSQYTDLYQETVKRFTRSSLSPETDRFSPSRYSFKSSSPLSQHTDASSTTRRPSNDFYLEATGRRRSSDHGSILTHDTEQFIIGQKVWVGGIRPGQIAYIGETHFAPGEWAGVVLDEPNGKNDGCVAGKRYFQCEPKRGIFSRLTRLTMAPLPGAQTPTSPLSKFSPERSRTVSPTASIRSSFMRSPGKNGLTVGDRVIVSSGFGSRPGILRYLGETQFASGNWCGIELDEASGKNDGSVDGIRYFECKAKYGVFVPIAKVSISPSSKKSRLSRTGSRESLTSIGTMNSIATTNTSRMRMSAQRKSSTFKPVAAATTPKSQFSMQDLLREKQQHIEQLMIERDLDREDTQNQGLQYQKNINELKTRVTLLERQLNEERKKGEDLQFSVDEATFCGDELNAQTQVYREKILELETKIKDISKGKITADDANSSSSAEIADLNSLLKEETQKFEVQINDLQDEQQRLLENIKYLQLQNETLQKELVEKDQSLEKFSLSECGIENLRKEMALLKEESDKEKDQLQTDYTTKLEEKVQEMKVLKDEISTLKGSIGTVEGENANLQDECNILKTECKNRDLQIESLNSEVAKKEAELSMRHAECSTLDELLKDQQQGNAKEKTFLEQKCQEIAKLKEEVKELTKTNHTLETNVQRTNEELKKLANIETVLKNAIKQDEEKTAAIQDAEVAMQELRNEYNKSQSENEELLANIKKFQQDWIAKEHTLIDHHNIELKEKETTIHEFKEQLKLTKESSEVFEKQLAETKKENDAVITTKTEEIISLKNEIHKMLEKTTALEGESTSAVQQMSAKISHLESQNKRLEDDLKNSNAMIEDQRLKSVQQDEHIASKLSELKSTMSSLENTSKLLEKLKQEHDSSINRRQELEDELRKSVEKNNQQQLELGDITRKLETTSQKCDNLVAQNETLQKEVITARSSSSDIQNELQKLNDSVQNKEKEIQNLINVADEDRIKAKGQMEELEQKLANASKDYAELREVIHNSKEELARKQQQITEMEEKTIKQELLLSDNRRQQDILQTKYESLQKQNETLLNDLTSLRTSSTDSNAELLKLTQEIASRQGAYEELVDKANTEKSSLESQLQAKQQRIDAMCSQVETLTSELKTLTEENFKRFELLKQEQDKCGKQELEMADIQRKLDSFVRKCEKLEEQNQCLQTDLNAFRTGSADSKSEISKLTEECAHKKKELQDLSDKSSNERLAFETRIQELKQNIQTQQAEMEGLRSTVQSLEAGNLEQSSEFDAARKELEAKAEMELKELKELEKTKKQKLVESFEAQLKNTEQTKSSLDEAITSLQQQIQLLQDELLKSQLDFKAKENEMQKQLEFANLERDKLQKSLKQSQTEGSSSLNSLQEENARLLQSIQHLTGQIQEKEDALVGLQSEIQQLRILQSNSKSELETQLQKLHNSLELRQSEYEHKSKLHEEDQHKIEELKVLIENLKTSNSNMTATNGQLAEALEVLEQEKYETANIFELFEMESDQNMESLVEKLSSLKQELASAQENVLAKDIELSEKEQNLQTLQATLAETQASLDEKQSIALDKATQLAELRQANEELQKVQMETQEELQKQHELEVQLEEYKKIIDEMDDTSTEKSTQLQQLQSQIKQLQLEKNTFLERECSLTEEYKLLQRKLELKDIEKQKEIVQLKQRINDLQSVNKLRQNGTGDTESGQPSGDASDESTAQINFLNSIIADMQKKNDTLKAKIEALEALPTDFTKPHAFDLITKRKPAPRLFCDICDVFDSHETEDCPLQASDDRDYSPPRSAEKNNNDPANKKDRKLPEPRKYCESCEVFGHEAGECDDECY